MKSIEVTIAGRAYPLKVTEEEEIVVLRVSEEINEKLRNLQNTYHQKDKQDCLSMALLTYAVENANLREATEGLDALRSAADQLEQSLLQIAL